MTPTTSASVDALIRDWTSCCRGCVMPALLDNGIPTTIPGNHSPRFAPAIDPTLEVGVKPLIAAAAVWLGTGSES